MAVYAVVGYGLTGAFAVEELIRLDPKSKIKVIDPNFDYHPTAGSQGFSRIFRTNTPEANALRDLAAKSLVKYRALPDSICGVDTIILGNYEKKINAAQEHAKQHLPVDRYTFMCAAELQRRYSFLNAQGMKGVLEYAFHTTQDGLGSGIINPESTLQALFNKAKANGVNFYFGQRVEKVKKDNDQVRLMLSRRAGVVQAEAIKDSTQQNALSECIVADQVIFAIGPWTPQFHRAGRLEAMRPKIATLYFFKILKEYQSDELIKTFPAMMLKLQGGENFRNNHSDWVAQYPEFKSESHTLECYLMKECGLEGSTVIKLGLFAESNVDYVPVDQLSKNHSANDRMKTLAGSVLQYFFPGLAAYSPAIAAATPDFTVNAPIDEMPGDRGVVDRVSDREVVIGGLSGIGAKVAPALGEIAAALSCRLTEPELEAIVSLEAREYFGFRC